MEIRNLKYLVASLLIGLGLGSCLEDTDFSGFITNYKPVKERFSQSISWNKAHAQKTIITSDSPYTLYLTADIHMGGTANFDAFLKNAMANNTAATFLLGDIVTGHKHDYDTLLQHLKHADPVPYFPIVGNHDLYFKGWQYFSKYFGSSTYTIIVENGEKKDLIVCLDSGGGTLGRDQLTWLKGILETRNSYRNCMVFTHNNFFRARHTTSTNPNIDELYVLLDWFNDYKVDVVVMGHDHQHSIEKFGSTTYITMDALQDSFKDASYLELSVQNTTIHYRFTKP